MHALVERAGYALCLRLGLLLRASRYSVARVVRDGNELRVHKRRRFYAPLLIHTGDVLVSVLSTGVRVLAQREWEARERDMYRTVYGKSIDVERNGTLQLPFLPGSTLASLLDDTTIDERMRRRAIELAVLSLARLHAQGFTHGDAMADNVLVDLETGVANWFDFETVHSNDRSMAWRCADDVRALLATCLVRTPSARVIETLELMLCGYDNESVTRLLASSFSPVLQRPLLFHLGQAPLPLQTLRAIALLLETRAAR